MVGADTKFTFQTETGLEVDNRGALFFFACAAPQKLGAATLYLLAARDIADVPLDAASPTTYACRRTFPQSSFGLSPFTTWKRRRSSANRQKRKSIPIRTSKKTATHQWTSSSGRRRPPERNPTGFTPHPAGSGSLSFASTGPNRPSTTR